MSQDYVIDTNLLVYASNPEAVLNSKMPREAFEVAFTWLDHFQSGSGCVILDTSDVIVKEYRRALSEQDFGHLVLIELMTHQRVKYEVIDMDNDGFAMLPAGLENVRDRDDRKFVAVAIENTPSIIAHGCDTDWYDCETDLQRFNILLEHVLDKWCRPIWTNKNK